MKELQQKAGVERALNLILDMKVRWSSTFAMLQRAYDLRDVSTSLVSSSILYTHLRLHSQLLNKFVVQIASEETSTEKQQALLKLQVSEAEWERVAEVLRILKVRPSSQRVYGLFRTNLRLSLARRIRSTRILI